VTLTRPAALVTVVVGAAACGSPPFVPPPPSPERVYALSEVDERPEIVLAPPLRYPDDPHLTGVDGVVVVRLVIDTAGNPEPATAQVVQTDDSALGRAGRALALKTLFRPGRVRGRVVQVLVDLPVEFSSAARPPVTIHVAGDVYGAEDVQERPRLISSLPLAYPAPLLLSRVTGRVLVEAVIDTAGSVEAASLRVIASTDPRFNDAAKAYVGKAHFTPGRIAGRTVRVRFQMPVEFKLPTRH
jgi:TonB family protein